MRIVINNIAASSGGALSILKSFYNYLVNSEIAKENEWIFLLSDNYIEETDNIKVIVLDKIKKKWVSRLKFDLYSGKRFISELKPDVVFSLQNTITFGLKCPKVLYMHQSIPFQKQKRFSFFKPEERILAIYQYIIGKLIKESIKKADITVVQTKWIKDAVIESTNVSSNKIIEIFPPQESFLTNKAKGNKQFKNSEFFYPAAKNFYKNHQCIYDACTVLSKKGFKDYHISLTIENEKNGNNENNISYLGKMPHEQVIEKYSTSTLIFPSYIETVGLPLLEARQMGTVILASDCPFSREVLDGYENAYYFDPFNPQQLAELMGKVLSGQIRKEATDKTINKLNSGWQPVIDILLGTGVNRE
nr:glycosyltransferase [Fredinandcohnia onubensis]